MTTVKSLSLISSRRFYIALINKSAEYLPTMDLNRNQKPETKRRISGNERKISEKQRTWSGIERRGSGKYRRRSSLQKYLLAQMTLVNLAECRRKKRFQNEEEEVQISAHSLNSQRSRKKSSSCRIPHNRQNFNVKRFFSRIVSNLKKSGRRKSSLRVLKGA